MSAQGDCEPVGLAYEDLDAGTRLSALAELREDVALGRVYLSPWLTAFGRGVFVPLLDGALQSETDDALATALAMPGILAAIEPNPQVPGSTKRVPYNAAFVLAELMFNRYYVRGLCRRLVDEGVRRVEVYRAKEAREPRPESERKIGALVDARELLDDHRAHASELETELGIPAGPGSGLSVRRPRLHRTDREPRF